MNNKFNLVLSCLTLLFLASCSETDEPGKYDNWRERNEAFIDSLQTVFDAKTDPELLVLRDRENNNIFFKKIKDNGVGDPAFYTSKVRAYYRGMLINESVFGAGNTKFYSTLYKDLDVFDQNFKEDDPGELDTPSWLSVSGVVQGWIAVLQQMKIGERWEIYIPWQSAYGSSGSGAILGYSTLIFDIEVVDIDYYPETK